MLYAGTGAFLSLQMGLVMTRSLLIGCALNVALVLPVDATTFGQPDDEDALRFVASTFIATFYHEYGHALVDVLALPVLGREEDAVDSLSNLLLHYLHDGDDGLNIIWDNALAWALLDALEYTNDMEWNFAGPHSLTPQRYEQFLCQQVGADPENRLELAEAAEFDSDRIAECAAQFDAIDFSWSKVLEGAEPNARSKGLRLVDTDPDTFLAQVLQVEIDLLNAIIGLPVWVDVSVEECGEFNAFYAPDQTRIIMCQEWAEGMLSLWDNQDTLLE
jgi:hypothetical protein